MIVVRKVDDPAMEPLRRAQICGRDSAHRAYCGRMWDEREEDKGRDSESVLRCSFHYSSDAPILDFS